MAKKKQVSTQVVQTASLPVKLDIGCGMNKKGPEWIGVDSILFPGTVDVQLNVVEKDSSGNYKKWPWEDNSVDEVHTSHFLEHLKKEERVYFFNELYRVMKPGAKGTIITPHWSSNRAYGDPTHEWPAVSEMAYFYLSRDWRLGNGKEIGANSPHVDIKYNPAGFSCNFSATWGFTMRQDLYNKHQEVQMFEMANYKDACQDMVCTIVCVKG